MLNYCTAMLNLSYQKIFHLTLQHVSTLVCGTHYYNLIFQASHLAYKRLK